MILINSPKGFTLVFFSILYFENFCLICVDTKSSVASFSEIYNLTLKLFTVVVYKWDSFYLKFLHTSNKNEDIIIHVLVIMSLFCIYLTLNPLQCWISLVIKCSKSCCVILVFINFDVVHLSCIGIYSIFGSQSKVLRTL